MANSGIGNSSKGAASSVLLHSHTSLNFKRRPRAAAWLRPFWVLVLWLVAIFLLIGALQLDSPLQLVGIHSASTSASFLQHPLLQKPITLPSLSVSSAGLQPPRTMLPKHKPTHNPYNGSSCIDDPVSGVVLQNATADGNFKYYLAALLTNRIFEKDLFHMSSHEIDQWIQYMLYAGVEHIYWYDTALDDRESQESHFHKYVQLGLVTYFRFHRLFPNTIQKGHHFEQNASYLHFLEHYGSQAKWVAHMDIDEYPFSLQDKRSCFLRRILHEFDQESPDVSQVLLQCLLFLGNPIGDSQDHGRWLLEKYQRRKKEPERLPNGRLTRQKPIFRPELARRLMRLNPHRIAMMKGTKTEVLDARRLRMNHYWGARATGFKADTPELLKILVHDETIQPIVDELKASSTTRNCSLVSTQSSI